MLARIRPPSGRKTRFSHGTAATAEGFGLQTQGGSASRGGLLSLYISQVLSIPANGTKPGLSGLGTPSGEGHDGFVNWTSVSLILTGWLLTTARFSRRGVQFRCVTAPLGLCLITAGIVSLF